MKYAVKHYAGILLLTRKDEGREISFDIEGVLAPPAGKSPESSDWLSWIALKESELKKEGIKVLDAGRILAMEENADAVDLAVVKKALEEAGNAEHLGVLRRINFYLTLESMRNFAVDDQMVIQAVAMHEELAKVCNRLSSRLREWVYWSLPEARMVPDNRVLSELVSKKRPEELSGELIGRMKSVDVSIKPFGARPVMWSSIQKSAQKILELYELRDSIEKEIESLMENCCPNLKEVAGALIGAKLLSHAGSLKRLCSMPASTIQLLGAEKALFRHLTTGARCPKHGLIIQHPLIASAGKNRGKASRMLADKIALAARIDYFKGGFRGKQLRKELEEKLR
ncbi:NOP58 family protein [Candidatus Woesearchaeota archaeon]|nr:MAG: NOP58 family protein [Candidatus Woesearchaeota archaeon]